MNPWWWVLIGLIAWLVAGGAAALVVGRVLWRRSQALVAPGPRVPEKPGQPAKAGRVRLWWVLQAGKRRRQERLARHGPTAPGPAPEEIAQAVLKVELAAAPRPDSPAENGADGNLA